MIVLTPLITVNQMLEVTSLKKGAYRTATVVNPGIVLGRAEAEDTVLCRWDEILGRGEGVSRRPELDTKVCSRLRGEDSKSR